VLELAASEVSYGPVDPSVFAFSAPAGVKVHEISASSRSGTAHSTRPDQSGSSHPNVTTRGHGVSSVAILEDKARGGPKSPAGPLPESLPKVKINGTSATELATPLGTVLSFDRAGVSYLLAGSVSPAAIEAVARGL
jgi:hypothetical protein